MMKCVNCGFEIPDGGAFCPGCGIRLGVKSINTKTKARIWPAVIIALFVAIFQAISMPKMLRRAETLSRQCSI